MWNDIAQQAAHDTKNDKDLECSNDDDDDDDGENENERAKFVRWFIAIYFSTDVEEQKRERKKSLKVRDHYQNFFYFFFRC